MRLLGRVIVVVLAIVGGLALLGVSAGIFAASRALPPPLPQRMVLKLDLNGGLAEAGSISPLARLEGPAPISVAEMVQTLERAAHDDRVAGIVADFDGASLGMAKAQEIRDAIAAFRVSGKKTVAYASSLEGGSGDATIPYYAASAFGEVWLQPSGDVGLTGFMVQSPFLKDALDTLGVKPEFGSRWEYKSAIEIFTRKEFSKEAKDSIDLLVQSWTRQTVGGIASSRNLDPGRVTALIDRAPLLAAEAKDGGLVDRLAYWDELEKALTDDGSKLVDFNHYAESLKPEETAAKVAFISGVGKVQSRDGGDSPLEDDAVFSAERITKAFHDAAKDPRIKAILFRIDSPGGSYVASDSIWRAVGNARAAGKPVIVSMGDVAASGAYFAAMAGDDIVAEPGTVTGSIGVFTGKLVLADLWKKLGVDWDGVQSGRNAGIWSANESFTPENWDRVNAILDHIYADFTGKASKGRHIAPESMDGIARGRIWPGDKAREVGLVDELGGYATAFVAVRRLAHLPSQNPIELVAFPKPRTPFEYVMEMVKNGHPAETVAALTRLGRLAATLSPVLDSTNAAGRAELLMPAMRTR